MKLILMMITYTKFKNRKDKGFLKSNKNNKAKIRVSKFTEDMEEDKI